MNVFEVFSQLHWSAAEYKRGAVGHTVVVRGRAFKCVRKRQVRQKEVIVVQGHFFGNVLDIGEDRLVREHDAFGAAGGAGSVDNRGKIIFGGAFRQLGFFHIFACLKPLVHAAITRFAANALFLFGRENHLFERGNRRVGIENSIPTRFGGCHEKAAAAVTHDVGGRFRRVNRVKRNGHKGVCERRLVKGEGVERIDQKHRHAIAPVKVHGSQRLAPLHHAFAKLTPGDACPFFLLVVVVPVTFLFRLGLKGVHEHLRQRFEVINVCMADHFDCLYLKFF